MSVADFKTRWSFERIKKLAISTAGQLEKLTLCNLPRQSLIAILIEPSTTLAAALLAVKLSGNVIFPIDVSQPAEKMDLTFFSVDAILLSAFSISLLENQLPESLPRIVVMDFVDPESCGEEFGSHLPSVGLGSRGEDLAYAVKTSATTNCKPRAVCGTNVALENRIKWARNEFRHCEDDIFCLSHSISFIDGLHDLLIPLLCGYSCVLFPQNILSDPREFVTALSASKVTRLTITPGQGSLIVEFHTIDELKSKLSTLLTLMFSGATLSWRLVKRFRRALPPKCKIYNLYGSTETAGDATFMDVTDLEDDGSSLLVPAGLPLPGVSVEVVEGEVVVRGVAVGAGYLCQVTDIDSSIKVSSEGYSFVSGDAGFMTASGILQVNGRVANSFMYKETTLQLEILEDIIVSHPEITHALVNIEEGEDGLLIGARVRVTTRGSLLQSSTWSDLEMKIQQSICERYPCLSPRMIQVQELISPPPTTASGKVKRDGYSQQHSKSKRQMVSYEGGIITTSSVENPVENSSVENRVRSEWMAGLANNTCSIREELSFIENGGTSLGGFWLTERLLLLTGRQREDNFSPLLRVVLNAPLQEVLAYVRRLSSGDNECVFRSPTPLGKLNKECDGLEISMGMGISDSADWGSLVWWKSSGSVEPCQRGVFGVDPYVRRDDDDYRNDLTECAWPFLEPERALSPLPSVDFEPEKTMSFFSNSVVPNWRVHLGRCVDGDVLLVQYRLCQILFAASHGHEVCAVVKRERSAHEKTEIIWRVQLNDRVEAGPTLCHEGQALAVATHSGDVFGIGVRSGGFIWRVCVGESVKSAPCLVRNKLWVGSHNNRVTIIDTSKKLKVGFPPELTIKSIPGSVFASPVVDELQESVAVGTTNGILSVFRASVSEENDDHPLWSVNVSAPIFARPVWVAGDLIVACVDGNMARYSSSGILIWRVQASTSSIFSPPLILGYSIITACHAGYIRSFQTVNGSSLWTTPTGSSISSGLVYVCHSKSSSSSASCKSTNTLISTSINGQINKLCACHGDIDTLVTLPGQIFSTGVAMNDGKSIDFMIGCRDNYVYSINIS